MIFIKTLNRAPLLLFHVYFLKKKTFLELIRIFYIFDVWPCVLHDDGVLYADSKHFEFLQCMYGNIGKLCPVHFVHRLGFRNNLKLQNENMAYKKFFKNLFFICHNQGS